MKEKTLSALLFIVSLLPFWFLYFLSDILYVLIYYVFGYRKAVVFDNLRNSFPEKDEKEIKSIAKKFYKYFPDLIVEAIKMKSITEKQVREKIELLNIEEVNDYLDRGIAVIGVTAHYCNWELGIHTMSLMNDKPKLVIYKPLSNKTFNDVYNEMRTRFGATMVPMKQILRHLVKLRGTPNFSIFVADQTPVYQDSDYYLEFLNQETLVYTGVERLAKLTNSPVVFCEIRRKPQRGKYYCRFTTLVEDPSLCEPHEITKMHNAFTERIIQEEPQYWLWSHRRWKRKRRT
ncbi:lysophospholipid acyltransferase family protein [Sphingobacterium hungaricum]|uniref:Lauroyl acyltransferase n=1 Tax=Sphingobacterium hungaricum TaxID=2082723 RepID=A0A928UX68_9SPHI|nr:lysophospholipid acyltransferase family protein [Sphingobacterium hungaricum]MBE8712219.1 lauroyl acyltransferase [Sphingobacterium hungaricum]